MATAINRGQLFAGLRAALFDGHLTQSQVDGIDAVLDAWEAAPTGDARHLAYELATAHHETAATMSPIREYGQGNGREYGKADPETGQTYFGRGFVQLTWRRNYELADSKLGLGGALVKNADLALEPKTAARILHQGMVEGWFTARRLATYFVAGLADPVGARHVVNGVDQAEKIAGTYRRIVPIVTAAAEAPEPVETTPAPPVPARAQTAPSGFLAAFLAAISRFLNPKRA